MVTTQNINWFHFMPTGSGGSFAGGDMGKACKIGTQIFVIPLYAQSVTQTSNEEIDRQIEQLIDNNKKCFYEFRDGTFTTDCSENWENKFENSVITQG